MPNTGFMSICYIWEQDNQLIITNGFNSDLKLFCHNGSKFWKFRKAFIVRLLMSNACKNTQLQFKNVKNVLFSYAKFPKLEHLVIDHFVVPFYSANLSFWTSWKIKWVAKFLFHNFSDLMFLGVLAITVEVQIKISRWNFFVDNVTSILPQVGIMSLLQAQLIWHHHFHAIWLRFKW